MTKKILTMIADSDTGEILYSPKDSVCTSFKIHKGSFTGEDVCKRSFDSFLRGVLSGRNLYLSITITDFKPGSELSIF